MAQPLAPSFEAVRRRTRTYDVDPDLRGLAAATAALLCPAGTIVATLSAAEPPGDGWKLCDGQWLAKADYPRLFAVLGVAWGEDGDAFRLPDLRGRALLGAGGSPALALGATGGAHQATLAVANLPAHTHAVADPGHGHAVTDPGHVHAAVVAGAAVAAGADLTAAMAGSTASAATGLTVNAATTGITVGATGGGQPFDILPPVAAVHWLVRT